MARVPHKVYHGSGDKILSVDIEDPAIIYFSCSGCGSNTQVETNGADSLLVNDIGPYKGQHLVNTAQGSIITLITIHADAKWTLAVDDIRAAKQMIGAQSGLGDTVLTISGYFTSANIENDDFGQAGAGNFQVIEYGPNALDPLLINTIGSYKGTVPLNGPALIQVISHGVWIINPN